MNETNDNVWMPVDHPNAFCTNPNCEGLDDVHRNSEHWAELRNRASIHTDPLHDAEWFRLAANEIERLRTALREIQGRDCYGEPCDCGAVADKALAQERDE